MPSREPLSREEIDRALQDLPGWSFQDDMITKTFELSNFRAAVSFIVRMGFAAEELNHHPNLENVYNRVTIGLTTHDAGNKVTEMDLALARKIEEFSWV
jgi:4a-hydroxytetrahydrobiopterin dehydratase